MTWEVKAHHLLLNKYSKKSIQIHLKENHNVSNDSLIINQKFVTKFQNLLLILEIYWNINNIEPAYTVESRVSFT